MLWTQLLTGGTALLSNTTDEGHAGLNELGHLSSLMKACCIPPCHSSDHSKSRVASMSLTLHAGGGPEGVFLPSTGASARRRQNLR